MYPHVLQVSNSRRSNFRECTQEFSESKRSVADIADNADICSKSQKIQEIQFQREQARIQREQEIRKEQARIQKLKARGFQGGGVGKGTKALIYAPNHPPVYEY